jgi:hypothetical protein
MIEMGVADEPVGGTIEIPGMGPEIEPEVEFGNAINTLNRRARITLNGKPVMMESEIRTIIEHKNLGAPRSGIG